MGNTLVTPYKSRHSSKDISANKHGGNTESAAAHKSAKTCLASCRYKALKEIHQQSGTGKEVALRLGKAFNAVSGRFSELKEKGLIETTGERRNGSAVLRSTFKGVTLLAEERGGKV